MFATAPSRNARALRAGRALCLVLALIAPRVAAADQRADIEAAVKAGTAAFVTNDFSAARATLLEAESKGEKAGLAQDKLMARVYLLLGAVEVESQGNTGQAVPLFRRALRVDADIKLSKSIAREKVIAAFKSAYIMHRTELEAAASPAPAPAPAPPPPAAAKEAAQAAADEDDEEDVSLEELRRRARAAREGESAGEKPVAAQTASSSPAVTAAPPPPPPPPPKPKEPEEPDLPADIPQPLHCPNPDEAPPGRRALLRCVAAPDLQVARVLFFYRLPGKEEFESAPANKTPKGWFVAAAPAAAFTGKFLQYYFEARSASDKPVASNGRWESPNLMMVRAGAPPVGADALAGVRREGETLALEDDDPLSRRNQDGEADIGPRGRYWISLSLGKGFGVHGSGELEWYLDNANNARTVAGGTGSTGLVVIAPEFGYRFSRRWAASLHSRHEVISHSGADDTMDGAPATGANAVFVRGIYFLQPTPALEVGLSASLGGGEGIRFVVPADENADLPRRSSDTVRGGPVLLGPGVTVDYWLNTTLAVRLAAQTFVTFPDTAFALDFNLGLSYGF